MSAEKNPPLPRNYRPDGVIITLVGTPARGVVCDEVDCFVIRDGKILYLPIY